jgi:hypothetical protein
MSDDGASALDDGSYDALVIDATAADDGCRVELTILGGPHKGEVVAVRTVAIDDDAALDLLGVPATIVVSGGVPQVTFEP